MTNACISIGMALLAGCFTVPATMAAQVPNPSAHTSTVQTQDSIRASQPQVCFTAIFSGPLPGKADYCLGMRDWNRGHYRNGLEFFKLAAGWGNKNAQYTLGLIHYAGHHVPVNVPLGLAWLKLADQRRDDAQISRVRRAAFKSATPAQRHQAEHLFDKLMPDYGDKVAAARAWHRLQHWQRRHNRSNSGCVRISGAQAAAAKRAGLAGVSPTMIRSLLGPTRPNGQPESITESALRHHTTVAVMRSRFASQNAGVCVTLHMQHHVTQAAAGQYFAGWMGVVTVEPLQVVPAPASSSGR